MNFFFFFFFKKLDRIVIQIEPGFLLLDQGASVVLVEVKNDYQSVSGNDYVMPGQISH